MYKLQGMYAAIPTPFFTDESVNIDGVKQIVNFLADEELHGIIVGGSTGEYTLLSTDERKAIIKAACEASDGRLSIVAGTGCPRAVDTIELSNFAADAGADAVLVITPHYMVMTEDMLFDYYKTVAENSALSVIIYHYSYATGVQLTPDFVKKLALVENIVGIKNTEDMDYTAQVIAKTKDNDSFFVANGYDSLMVANLATGGDASMGVVHNIVPRKVEDIFKRIQQNDIIGARKIYSSLMDLIMLLDKEPYPGPLKVAYDLMGLPGGNPRSPVAPPSDEMRREMEKCLRKLGVI